MNKLVIKDISIINKNKNKITGVKLENKDHKFILYSYLENNPLPNENFIEFSFEEEFTISSKKKMNDLNIKIEKNDTHYFLTYFNKKVYYIKDSKPTLTHQDYKLIL